MPAPPSNAHRSGCWRPSPPRSSKNSPKKHPKHTTKCTHSRPATTGRHSSNCSSRPSQFTATYEWEIDSKLVRGLDYYNRTVFEIAPSGATGAQSSILGGGRYDGLIELLGGTPTPGVGFAAGLDRVYDILVATRDDIAQVAPQVVVLHDPKQGDYNAVYELAAELRRKLHKRALAAPDRSLKAQMRFASRENAEYALIVEDATTNTPAKYHLKHMATGEQQTTSDKDQLFSRLRVADEQ